MTDHEDEHIKHSASFRLNHHICL